MTRRDPKSPAGDEQRLNRHHDARGKKKQKLSDLSRQAPHAKIDPIDYMKQIQGESDRGVVIMASAMVEHGLTYAIVAAAGFPGDKVAKQWFEGPTAPFPTFATKIQMGRALSIYGDVMASRLALVKDIRNAFSHCASSLDFSHPLIQESCAKLQSFQPVIARKPNWRLIFITECTGLNLKLADFASEQSPRQPKYR